ncbi:dynein heavy chain, putative [Bodo saltans]|uniref:Dynein heavy chain, putative n=1 Tax=Bodo saltans TaxID=75058 RepID=A0A0S4IM00_BODSA|nr:dynein heavy chain, putative [Bodo saltans]|eukprot:CUE71257.1 dynein heavy chain, putative [Bodo saltans]
MIPNRPQSAPRAAQSANEAQSRPSTARRPPQDPRTSSPRATTPRSVVTRGGGTQEEFTQRSIGNAIGGSLPNHSRSGTPGAQLVVSDGSASTYLTSLYDGEAHASNVKRFDVGRVPDIRSVISSRPSSAKSAGLASTEPLHPKPPQAKGTSVRSPPPQAAVFDVNDNTYTFGTATAHLRAMQGNKSTPSGPPTAPPHPPQLSSSTVKSTPIVASAPQASTLDDDAALDSSAKDNSSDTSSRPTTAKRPQSAKAAFEVKEAANAMATTVHMSTLQQLHRSGEPAAPNDKEDMEKMKTFVDVVSYYGRKKHAGTPTVKFVHMKRQPLVIGATYRPYDLVVVPADQCVNGEEHFVVSRTSVVQMLPAVPPVDGIGRDQQPAQLQTVAQFTQESALFNIITKIRFFRLYLKQKMFSQWLKNIRVKQFMSIRAKLAKRAFTAKKSYASPLRKLHQELASLQGPPLVNIPHVREGLSLDRFSSAMVSQKMLVLDFYRTTMESAEHAINELIGNVQQRADVPDFGSQEALEQYVLFMEDQAAKRNGGIYNPNAIPITKRKEQMKRRLSELRGALEDQQQLAHFLRLIDYIAAENMFYKALSSIRNLVDEIAQSDNDRTLFFLIAVTFGEEGVLFVPAEDELLRVTSDAMDEIIASVVYLPRLITSANVKSVLEHASVTPKLHSMSILLREDARVLALRQSSKHRIEGDFCDGRDATNHFGRNKKWLAFVNKTWPSMLGDWNERLAVENTTRDFLESRVGAVTNDEFTDVFRKGDEAFLNLKEMHAVRRGCLVITSTVVLDFLMAKLRDITAECREKVLAVAKSRLDRVAATLNQRTKALQERPTQLSKFASFVSYVHDQVHDIAALNEACDQIEQLYIAAELNGCEPGQEAGRREVVLGRSQDHHHGQSLRNRFEEAAHNAKDYVQGHSAEMGKKLMLELESESDNIATFGTLVDSQILKVYSGDVVDCLSFLTQLEENISVSEAKLKTLLEWVKLFEVPASLEQHTSSLAEVKTQLKAKRELWLTIGRFHEARSKCYTVPLSEADPQTYSKEIDELYAKTYNRLNPRHQSDASERLLELLREEKLVMGILIDLGNKNLKREHWAKILSNQSRTFDASMTLESLKHMKLFDAFYRDLIHEQSAVASGEATLLSSLEEIKTKWGATQFSTKPFRDIKDQYILDDVSEIIQQVEEHQLLIQSCLASRFVTGVRPQIEDWERKLHLLTLVLDEWIVVQNSWMYLAYIFAGEDMKRQLPTETAMFKHVNNSVKELVNRAHNFKNCIVVATDAPILETLKGARTSLDVIQKKLEEYLETKRAVFPRFYFLSNDELLSILSDVRNPRAVRPHLRKCFDSINDLVFKQDSQTDITGVVSVEGEVLSFLNIVAARGGVENWLGAVEQAVNASLKANMTSTLNALAPEDGSRRQWYLNVQQGEGHTVNLKANPNASTGKLTSVTSMNGGHPAQCIQAIDAVQWTVEVEEAIARTASGESPKALEQQYAAYRAQLSDTVKTVRLSLTPLQRSLIQTILVLSVHNRDVIKELVDQKVSDSDDFAWRKHLRSYYSHETQLVYIEQVRAKLAYCYEYLGSAKRLVITPLTDRAFLTCTQALHLNLGAAPQGPAGTGKTESVKDLGKALARHVVVFNCSDGINTAMMSRMFSGLAQAGSWACFDEFNRIELEVLSVVAQQMLEITSAVSQRLTRMTFDGHELALNPHFGVFITMNPGYAGRTELPDNLQALFRPVCMMIPDYRLIAEIMFFSEGFLNAQSLSVKMVQLYKLSSEQLSKQDHYDFGMRAVKSILVTAGSLKRAEPNADEDMLLIRAMRASNLPKFLREDANLFLAIIKDLYPSLEIEASPQQGLSEEIERQTLAKDLVISSTFTDKTLQLFDIIVARFGVMLVGPTLASKTTSSLVLEQALSSLATSAAVNSKGHHPHYAPTTRFTVNPKALSRQELYGSVNVTTREWVDGILSHMVRSVCSAASVSEAAPHRSWVTFDGPVDALWIENLNTVLDDNKMLCLVNGERIKLPDSVTFLFEVQDLRAASPATVSRCGMVYYDSSVVDWKQQLQNLGQALAKKYSANEVWKQDVFDRVTDALIGPALEFLEENGKEWIPTSHSHRIHNIMKLLDAALAQCEDNDDDPAPTVLPPPEVDEDGQELPADGVIVEMERPNGGAKFAAVHALSDSEAPRRLFEMTVIFAVIWGIGGNLCDDAKANARNRFSQFIKEKILDVDDTFPQSSSNVAGGTGAVIIDSGAPFGVFDVFPHKGSLQWVDWAHKVPEFLYRRRQPFGEILVATPQTVSSSHIVSSLVKGCHAVLINGTTGTGKSVGVQQSVLTEVLHTDDAQSNYQSFTFVMSAQSSGHQLQELLEAHLRKHPSKLKDQLHIGPSTGKTMVMVIDDINMPSTDEYGACPTLELLRQILVQGGMYDTKRCMFKNVSNVVTVACCGPPGGNRTELSPRLTSQFFTLCQPQLGDTSVQRIFGSILQGFLSTFNGDVRGLSTGIARATIDVFKKVAAELLPTPERAHYVFNMRDIGRVVQGVTQSSPSEYLVRNDMLRLWVHECFRVFCDRLISSSDRSRFRSIIGDVFVNRFHAAMPMDWDDSLYSDFTSLAEVPVYRPIELGKGLEDVLAQKLREYAVQHNKDLDLVMFDDAVRHLCRLCRVLRQARGNALLVGIHGCGRQSLAQLAAFLCRCKRYQIQLTSAYDHVDFRKDIRNVLKMAGGDNEPVAFILTDSQIVKEVFLEDVNSLLNTGEITNLWEPDDLDGIIASTRERVRRLKKPETVASMLATFVTSCRDNLHIVLTMNPMGAALFRRLRTFPSLLNCMTIDWYDPWPAKALHSVANKMLSEALVAASATSTSATSESLYEEDLGRISDLCEFFVYVHTTVEKACIDFDRETRRKAYCTPTSYIGLLQSFAAMLRDQREASEESILRFQTGLERILDANRRVDDMKNALIRLQPELETSTTETQVFAAQVERESKAAAEIAQGVAKEEAQCALMMREAQAIKDECQAELDKAMPAYNEALDALNSLNIKDIQETKAYTSPPKKVEMVMDAVLTVIEEAIGWENAKKVLGRSEFVTYLILLQPKQEKLAKAEAALEKAKATLAKKQAELAELEARLKKLKQQYDDSMARLKQLEADKARTELHLARAAKLLSGLTSEHERWTKSIAELEAKSQHAMALTALASAFVAYAGVFDAHYRDTLVQKWIVKCQAVGIPMDTSKPFRVQDVIDPVMVRHWNSQGLPIADFSTQNATIVSKSTRWCLCVDPHHQANGWIKNAYKAQGLIVLRMNDPNLTRHLESAVRGGHAVLIEDVETNMDASLDPVLRRETFRSGGRLMITVRDQPIEYNPSFFLIMTSRIANPHFLPEVHVKTTVINFDVTVKGLEDQLLSEVVRCEKRELEDRADQLFMQVSDARQQLKSIEDQILSLLANSGANLLENDLLITTLHQSKQTGIELTEGLAVIEGTSVQIQDAREVYRPIATRGAIIFSVIQHVSRLDHMYQTSLHAFIQQFRRTMIMTPTEDDGADNNKKQGELENTSFTSSYDPIKAPRTPSIIGRESAVEERERLVRRRTLLIQNITLNSYQFVTRSLFEVDRGVFRFLMAASIARSTGAITDAEWSYFLCESGGTLPQQLKDLPGEWMPDTNWENLLYLSEAIPAFRTLADSIATNEGEQWSTLRNNPFVNPDGDENSDAASPEGSPRSPTAVFTLPPMFVAMSLWHRMILLRTLNSSALGNMAKKFVEVELGRVYNEVPAFDLGSAFAQSNPSTPICFLLTPGTDPTITFSRFAERNGMATKTTMISLGQGQGSRAEAAVHKAMVGGQWVFLQNCHVYASWLPQLAHLLESVQAQVASGEGVHSEFRLWLSTLPCSDFPISVLQSAIKLTREPPRGVKANLRDSLALTVEHDAWRAAPSSATGGGSQQLLQWRKFLVAFSITHAILQERRKFGPVGWNVPYSWSLIDLENTLRISQGLCENEPLMPNHLTGNIDFSSWDAIYHLIGDICYGGRVTDLWDSRTLRCIVERVVNPSTFGPGGMSLTEDGRYRVPSQFDSDSLMLFVEKLPGFDPPELFGLHPNAEIRVKELESQHLLKSLVLIQPPTTTTTSGASSSKNGASDASSSSITVVNEVIARLPVDIDADPNADVFVRGNDGVLTPLGNVCSQECQRYNTLLKALRSQLVSCLRALKGSIALNDSLTSIMQSLSFGQVPHAWESMAYPSMKSLYSWVTDLNARVDFFRDWVDGGAPQTFWLGGFTFPQGFVAAVLQTHCRRYAIPVDALTVASFPTADVDPLEALLEPLATGVYLHGLTLEGARWNVAEKCLDELIGKNMQSVMPIVALIPVLKPNLTPQPSTGGSDPSTSQREIDAQNALIPALTSEEVFECPVYKIGTRAGSLSTTGISSNFILSLSLNAGQVHTPNHWIERGCALLTSTGN